MVTNVKSKWVDGDLYFYDKSDNEICHLDGTNRALVLPSGISCATTSAIIKAGDGSTKLVYDSGTSDYNFISNGISVTESNTDEADVKNLRLQLSSGEALTGKHLKSIYSRVDVDHAVADAYCFQGSMRVGAGGTPSLLVYGISQSLVLNPTAHTQLTEARCVYASISGGEGVNGTSTVYMGVVSNTDATNYTTAVYEGNVAAFCKVASVFAATGQGTPDQIIYVANANGTPYFANFSAATSVNCIAAGGNGDITFSNAWLKIKVKIGNSDYYLVASAF